MPKKALIIGVSGQDGSYLTEFLAAKGYEVHGLVRRPSTEDADSPRLHASLRSAGVVLHQGDLSDGAVLREALERGGPDEIYNLGAVSQVSVSFDEPLAAADINAMGTLRLLEAARRFQRDSGKRVRFYQAGSSEMYGKALQVPQNETTPFHPRSPYAVAKVFGFWQTVNHRECFGLHACNGILFNHESPRRREAFVTRKITRAATRIKLGLQDKLLLGNLDSKRDWGFAGDYVEAMWLMLQQDRADDYVIASGETYSVGEFLSEAFARLGLEWERYVERDERYLRPSDIDCVRGDAAKARNILGWRPRVGFKELVHMMVDADMELARRELLQKNAGTGASSGPAGPEGRP